jgi:hypothetical protein
MPKHMYLPEIASNIGEPPVAGQWNAYDRKIMLAISDGIVISEGAQGRGVSSVPDVWARPLMFQSAIRPDSRHPLRERLVQEWRGLLSLLALYKLHRYQLEIVPVRFGGGAFETALQRLAPHPVQLEYPTSLDGRRQPPYRWTDTLLIRFDGIPVGAFSPSTMVYTASAYQRRIAKTSLNLQDAQGYLRPPGIGEREEMLYVASWVEALQSRLNAPGDPKGRILDTDHANPDRGIVTSINALLDAWLVEMRAALGLREGARVEATDVVVAADPIEVTPVAAFLDEYRVYRELLRPLRRAEGVAGEKHSDFLLEGTRTHRAYSEVVVITPRLLRTGGKIWESKRLNHLGGEAGAALERYFADASGIVIDREDLKRHNALWIRPERYFLTDTLSVTNGHAPFLADDWQRLNGDRRFLLPFRREILDFFSPADIRDVLRPSYKESESGVTFTFHLPVAGATEKVEKTYRYKDAGSGEGSIVTTSVPTVELFPRYIDEHWRRYYLFQGNAETFRVSPLLRPRREGGSNGNSAAANEPERATRVVERTHGSDAVGKVRLVEITGDDAFPEALEFGGAAGDPRPIGLVLVPVPEQPPGLAGEWRVGIDFGTSNTNVFRQTSPDGNAERWRFDFGRYLWRVTESPAAMRDAMLETFFIPPRAVELPIPTVLRVFQDARKDHPLLDYFIYFSPEYRLPRNVHTDIKWNTDTERKTEYFLECLLLLVLVEAATQRVGRIELACSYPKAFSDQGLILFKGEWQRVLGKLLDEDTGVLRHRRSEDGGDSPQVGRYVADRGKLEIVGPIFEVEGIAAGEFFASERTIANLQDRAKKQIAAVTLDVGGGTTDISIWYHNDIVLDASVLLAGRQISRLLQQNSRILEVLFSNEAAIALEEKKNEPAAFAARLNAILRREEAHIQEMLIKHANQREVQWIRRMLAVEFGAIAFYAASLLGAADRSRQGGVAAELKESGIALHWGGNASKFINWIDFGRYDKDGIASKMLGALLFNALKDVNAVVDTAKLAQKQSPGHKSEAAGGLVVMSGNRARSTKQDGAAGPDFEMPESLDDANAAVHRSIGTVCGENIELVDGPLGHLDTISEKLLFDGNTTRFRRTSLDRLSRFVDIVNFFGVRFGLLTDDSRIVLDRYRTTIVDSVRSHFIEAQSVREGQRLIEPVFIMEVKILLDLLKTDLR